MARQVPWTRIFAEGLAIVVSILLAFGIQAWWEGRVQSDTAADYMDRVAVDLRQDTTSLAFLLEGMSRKRAALWTLQAAITEPPAADELAQALLQAELYGWGQFTHSGTTFQDLRSTGNLQLIRDAQLRASIVDYYERWALEQGRISARRSQLPSLVYGLLQIDFGGDIVPGDPAGDDLRQLNLRQLRTADLPQLQDEIASPAFRRELRHELNYTGFARAALVRLHAQATHLLGLIE